MSQAPTPDDIETTTLDDRSFPLVVRPKTAGVDPYSWAAEHRIWITERLAEHGAILFRGFGVDTPKKIEQFAHSISSDFPEFREESSPRHTVEGKVQTSTDYPAEYPIQFHNEFSYSSVWPLKIYFGCEIAADEGGETPLADSRKILQRLDAATRGRFADKGLLYQRNFLKGRGVAWQTAFGTDDRAQVEASCRERGIECEWRDDGGLTTKQRSPAIARHPETGEEVWFNHGFFWNVRSLEPEEIRDFMLMQPEEDLATNSYYGDGSPIEPETIEELRAAYEAERTEFPWQVGDILLVDNMLAAHGRRPYSGQRKVLAVMAEACSSHG